MKRSILAIAACAAVLVAGLVGSALAQDPPSPLPALPHDGCHRWTLMCGKLFDSNAQATLLLDTHTGTLYIVGHGQLIPVRKP